MLIEATGADPRLQALARPQAGPEPGVVARCDPSEKPALRLMSWNIDELGGGFHRPARRPDYAIDAYAALIHAMRADLVVLMGLTGSPGEPPSVVGEGEAAEVRMGEAPKDTGAAEAERILAKLREADPAGGWQARFLKGGDGSHAYVHGAATCILQRAKGHVEDGPIAFERLDVCDGPADPGLGLTGKFLAARFAAEKYCPHPLTLMAPLGVPKASRPGSPSGAPETAPGGPPATGNMPDTWVLALSAPENLLADRSAYASLRSGLDALYRAPGEEGSRLRDDFWKKASESRDDLLGNFAALGSDQVARQDAEMHWEAMEPPRHPASVRELAGWLADTFLIRHDAPGKPPVVEEMRSVDLARAALSAGNLGKLRGDPDPPASPGKAADASPAFPKEDSLLAAQAKAFRRDRGGLEPGAEAVDALAQARHFSLALSRHWPVIAQICWQA